MALPEEYQYVRVRIKTEQYRFLDWATVAGLSESDGDLVLGRAGRCMLLDILEQQHNLLHRFGRFDDRLKRLAKPLLSEVEGQDWDEAEAAEGDSDLVRFPASADLYKKALKYIRATRTIPARLRWVSCDKKSIEVLLGKITSLNDFLTELLDKNQVHQLLELQVITRWIPALSARLIAHLNDTDADPLRNHAAQLLVQSTSKHHSGGERAPARRGRTTNR